MRPSSYSYRVHTQKKQYLEDLHNRRMEIVKEGNGGVLLFCCFFVVHTRVCVCHSVCVYMSVCVFVCVHVFTCILFSVNLYYIHLLHMCIEVIQ